MSVLDLRGRSLTLRDLRAALPRAEFDVEAALHQAVRRAGGNTFKLAPTVKGIPDRLVLLPHGQIHLVELKAHGGRLSPSQLLWHRRAAALGIMVHVITGSTEARQWVKNVTRGTDQ